jgi:hypothetical protein
MALNGLIQILCFCIQGTVQKRRWRILGLVNIENTRDITSLLNQVMQPTAAYSTRHCNTLNQVLKPTQPGAASHQPGVTSHSNRYCSLSNYVLHPTQPGN